MRKSCSCSSLQTGVPVGSRRLTSTHAHIKDLPPIDFLDTTEAVAEAFARTPIQNIGVCTELYGFPNEVLQKPSSVLHSYIDCLMEPVEPVHNDWESNEYNKAKLERFARWIIITRKRKRRWSTGNAMHAEDCP